MNPISINTSYWKKLIAGDIPGNNVFPEETLFNLLPQRASLLDIGCGSGTIAELMSTKGFIITAIDINKDTIRKNQQKDTKVRYLLGNITALPFNKDSFDAVIFGFTLVNILPQIQREQAIEETTRVLKKNGVVWLNEGLVSEDYSKRYKLSNDFIHDEHSFFVFNDKELSSKISSKRELEQAINSNQIERIAHHYTEEELSNLFKNYEILYKDIITVTSPRSRSKVRSIVLILRKR